MPTPDVLPPDATAEFDAPALAADILAGRCVLLLGPDLLLCNGQPVNDALKNNLWTQHRRHIAHFFEREGLFKFQTETAKKRIQTDAIPQFFKAACPDEEALRKLLAIPFHLVVQVTPDTFLSDAAHRHSVAHQFKFFAGNGKTAEPVDAPTPAMPLFYNLCGTKGRPARCSSTSTTSTITSKASLSRPDCPKTSALR